MDAYTETLTRQRLSKLAQALFWYNNVPDDETIIRYVHQMREYYRELGQGDPIAEAIAAEREACAQVAETEAKHHIRWGDDMYASICRDVAAAIRARSGRE